MKNYLLLLFSVLLMQCANSTKITEKLDNAECDSIGWKLSNLMNDYYMIDKEQNFARLDSALVIVDSIEDRCGEYNPNIFLFKLSLLSIKSEYSKALAYAEQLDELLIGDVYKSIVVNRFKAMVATEEGNIDIRNRYIRDIVDILQSQLPENEVDSVFQLCNSGSIMEYPKSVYLIKYYYYRAQLEGIDKITNELNSALKDCEEDVLWILKPNENDDFMIFDGL